MTLQNPQTSAPTDHEPMTEQNAEATQPTEPLPPPTHHSSSSVRTANTGNRISIFMLWVVLLVLAGTLAGVIWFGFDRLNQQTDQQVRLNAVIEQADKLRQQLQRYEAEPVHEQIETLSKEVRALQNDNEINKRYYSQRPLVGDDVLMYEIEYRVRFAEQQLMVGNADIALSMLSKAEDDLAALKRLDLGNVRVQLGHNLEELRQTPAFDGAAYITRIDRALNAIQDMPPYELPTEMPQAKLPPLSAEEEAQLTTSQRWWRSFKTTALSVVRVRVGRSDEVHTALIDVNLDRQELRLRLLSLRMMVLVRNPEARTEAISLNSWLTQRFDDNDVEVKAVKELLTDLAASAIVAPLPDVKDTLAAIRAWRAAQR